MNNNMIVINGIKTNNLKNIDLKVKKNTILAITGISGGGKSSLAYSTLYELSKQEFMSLENGYDDFPNYKIECHFGIIPAVAIKQKNTNINTRSTLYTYLNIISLLNDQLFRKDGSKIDYNLLKINNPNNYCKDCNGQKLINSIDLSLCIDEEKSLSQHALIPWKNSLSDKKYQLLMAFCKANNIDITVPYKNLSSKNKELILNHKSTQEFKVNFKHEKKRRSRTLQYIGLKYDLEKFLISESISDVKNAQKYCVSKECNSCLGTGLNIIKYKNINFYDVNFIDFLTIDIDTLCSHFNQRHIDNQLTKLLNQIKLSGIGYLNLTRTIPSLSGGELQKLNFSKLCSSKITNILIILDEISSQLHVSDYDMMLKRIKELNKVDNTIIIVEHNPYFYNSADSIIEIGPVAGKNGGFIVDKLNDVNINIPSESKILEFLEFKDINKNNVKSMTFKAAKNRITALVGRSGSGKSSIAKYLEESIKNVTYISQNSIKGNITSNVATITGLNNKIMTFMGCYFNQEPSYFSSRTEAGLGCLTCNGLGIIKISRSYESDIQTVCPSCNGLLFSNEANKYQINGFNISDIYNTPISELKNIGIPSIEQDCYNAELLGLAHLTLNRKTYTLSGGELKRLKLMSNLPIQRRKDTILIIDEPCSGLDNHTSVNVMQYLRGIANEFKSLIVIDHKPVCFLNCDHIVEIGPGSGINGGKIIYSGDVNEYYLTRYLPYIEYPEKL